MPLQRDGTDSRFRRYSELDGKTQLICVGAMKAATSWVYAHLSDMPTVAVSPLKEVQFFNARFPENAMYDADLLAMKRLAFHIGQKGNSVENLSRRTAFQASVDRVQMIYDDNAYFGHFASLVNSETRVLADVTPAYSAIGQGGFEFMRQLCAGQNISTKILYILRDPVDRLWSHMRFLQQLDRTFDPQRDWEKRLADPATLARCDYEATIKALASTFPSQDVLVLFYESLFDHGFSDLCRWLNLTPPEIDSSRRENETSLKMDLPEEAASVFRSLLKRQYAFCHHRFGDTLPSVWRNQMIAI